MSSAKRRIKAKKKRRHINVIFVLFLAAAGIFFFYQQPARRDIQGKYPAVAAPEKTPVPALTPAPPPALPRVSIVMDDLGPNKKAAERVFRIKAPLTLSVLPQEVYTAWIAREGHRLGHEIIGHIPMEAQKPHRLGNGGLYTWMSRDEIIKTLRENLRSIPYIKGVSTHMGSAFTQDERAMQAVLSELKKRRLIFLDSRTTPKSVGFKLAKAQELMALQRDVFLDDKDDPREIEIQWKRLVTIAGKKGYAIAQAHPRKNTLEFLQKILGNSREVQVVPLSALIGP